MSVMQLNPFLKEVVRGVVIVIAVGIYTGRGIQRRRARFGPRAPGAEDSANPRTPATTEAESTLRKAGTP